MSNVAASTVGTLVDSSLPAISKVIAYIFYIIGFIAAWFVTLGGTLTNWALDLNSQVLTSISVQTGWVLSRDLANLGFVLVIIFLAFTTILRIESYQTKKVLVRLVTAALLINFSLVIAGVFIDFSGIMTNFFLAQATGGPNNLALVGPKLAGAFEAQTLFSQKTDQKTITDNIQGISNDINKFIVFIASMAFVTTFTVITAISLLSLAAMLFIRYIALILLLILMPIAWLFYIWPDLQSYWSKWWHEFMHWVFFAPAVSFFIYLALQIALTFQKHPGTGAALAVDGTDSMALLIQNFGSVVGQMLSVLGILYGGMYTAQKMGIAGADFGFSVAGKVKGMMLGTAAYTGGALLGNRGAAGLINRASTALTNRTVNENLNRIAGSKLVQSMPGVRYVAQDVSKRLGESQDKRVDDLMKHYDSLTKEGRANAGTTMLGITDPVERAAWMASMAKNGQMKDAKESLGSNFDGFAQTAVDRGGKIAKELIAKDPELAKYNVNPASSKWQGKSSAEITKARKEEVAKAYSRVSADSIDNISAESFTSNPEYMAQVRTGFIAAFGEKRKHEDKDLLVTKLGEQIKLLNGNLGKLSNEERNLLNNLTSKLNFMAKSPAWTGYITSDLEPFIKRGKKNKKEDEEE
ncbi:MAG: hypothetical protein KGI60_03640 [Patescibacteria group bacterium]|nr:hypothetical protein [Patescibacteria group bacterium]